MAIAARTESGVSTADLTSLRARLDEKQGTRVDTPLLPVHPLIAGLLPERGLRPGAVYSVAASPSLFFTLLAGPSQAGSWSAIVGMPALGAEAAAGFGVDLSKLVLIPDPGSHWLTVTSAIAEVLPIVGVMPQMTPRDGDVARLRARLRDRGAVLVVMGAWPQADAMLSLSDPEWEGLGEGHGYLTDRAVTVTVSSRRFPVPRSSRMLLPGPDGAAAAAPAPLARPWQRASSA